MTYIYSLIGEYLFPIIFVTELIEVVLHGSSMANLIPMGRKFNEGLVRFQFVVEALSIWYCFWHINYISLSPIGFFSFLPSVFVYYINNIIYYVMAFHFIFHMLNNFFIVVFYLDDFSEPFEEGKEKAKKIIVPWDFSCHCYNIYCLSKIIGSSRSIICSLLVVTFLRLFPKNLIYAKEQKIKV